MHCEDHCEKFVGWLHCFIRHNTRTNHHNKEEVTCRRTSAVDMEGNSENPQSCNCSLVVGGQSLKASLMTDLRESATFSLFPLQTTNQPIDQQINKTERWDQINGERHRYSAVVEAFPKSTTAKVL